MQYQANTFEQNHTKKKIIKLQPNNRLISFILLTVVILGSVNLGWAQPCLTPPFTMNGVSVTVVSTSGAVKTTAPAHTSCGGITTAAGALWLGDEAMAPTFSYTISFSEPIYGLCLRVTALGTTTDEIFNFSENGFEVPEVFEGSGCFTSGVFGGDAISGGAGAPVEGGGGRFDVVTDPNTDDGMSTLTISGNSSNSGSYFCFCGIYQLLPVELSFFGVEFTSDGVLAKWTTESEIENLGFTLDRRVEGTAAWSELATYQTEEALLGQGSTPSATDYEYLDALVKASTTYEYRLADVDYNNTVTYHATRTVTVTSSPSTREVPDEFTVREAYPNPFNPSTTIDYYIPLNPPSIKGDDVVGGLSIQIYDITGKLINTLIDQVQPSGWHSVQWNGKDQVGANVPTGAYLVRVKAGTEVRHSKVMLLK